VKCYYTVNQGDVRAIQLIIRDREGSPWYPTSATTRVVNSDGITVQVEKSSIINSNSAIMKLTNDVTSIPGKYNILWKLVKVLGQTYTCYCKVELNVKEI
jgi:hypothetical protein